MRNLMAIALLALLLCPAGVKADDNRGPAIRSVIERQLAAFAAEDETTAFAIAAPAIQRMFGSAPNFMTMVQKAYPQIFAATGHKFLRLTDEGGRIQQRVMMESGAGTVVVRYYMTEIDGQWRIEGCEIETLSDA